MSFSTRARRARRPPGARTRHPRLRAAAVPLLTGVSILAAGCGSSTTITRTVNQTRLDVVPSAPVTSGGFDPAAIYARESPGVVTVISVFSHSASEALLGSGAAEAVGSGFVLSPKGEIVTNAHVVTAGAGSQQVARQVYVQFADLNQVPATVVGTDPNADVALLRVNPTGLTLRPLPLGNSSAVVVGEPVSAIGSPFDEPESLSVGVVSGLDRTIASLVQGFSIEGAIQTDAAINHGNSGGPLVNAAGRVIGINAQISSSSGGGEGVGFAIPINQVVHSIAQLRVTGRVAYAYLGVSTSDVFPQLAARFGLGVDHGAWVQQVNAGPAQRAGVRGGRSTTVFEAQPYLVGGDVIVAVDNRPITRESDVAAALAADQPGQTIPLVLQRGPHRLTVHVTLAQRPSQGVAP